MPGSYRFPTILFIDIDGVLSIPTEENAADSQMFARGLPAWPIPMAYPLLRAIAKRRSELHPVWLSAWGSASTLWNERAGTRCFPIAYGLSKWQTTRARHLFPGVLPADRVSATKLLAVRYYLRHYPTYRVIWLEDGHTEQEKAWAAQNEQVLLLDTTKEPLLTSLLVQTKPLESAAESFIVTYLCEEVTMDE